MRAVLRARRKGHQTESGNYIIDLLLANVCKQNVTRFPYEIVRLAEDIAGGIMVTAPSEKDFRDPKLGKYVEKYLKGVEARFHGKPPENPAPDRKPSPRYGGGRLPYGVHARRGQSPRHSGIMIARQGNLGMKKELAKKIAHIKE